MKVKWTEKEKKEIPKLSRNEIEIIFNKICQIYLSGAIDVLGKTRPLVNP